MTVRQAPDGLAAEVEDNGLGFAVSEQGKPLRGRGLGLLGMRERAAGVGGSLVIDSSPGHGTRIHLRIPLAQAEDPGSPVRQEVTA